ncbi:DUF2306 domain-containing protein [Microbispora sp. NPDC046973]|uniref:DUF2306 domain-containing protein n=1 Tax=Microbispora sp. NPDC046973 TaxID=3155022 RepID=UPI0033D6E09A
MHTTIDSPPPVSARRRPWWRRGWTVPLGLVTAGFLAFSLPPYLTGDPSLSRVPQPQGFGLHYPLLVAHVLFASVAMVTAFFQVWPWFRRRHPVGHRRAGRVYVFAGVLPAGLTGLVIGARSPFGLFLAVSDVLLALLWLAFTVAGWRAARARRYADHRRWMLRSAVLTYSIITNRAWTGILIIALPPLQDTVFRGDPDLMAWTISGLSGWLGWTIPLLAVEWYLEREVARRGRRTALAT